MIKTPKFWNEDKSYISFFLMPLTIIYYFLYKLYLKIKKESTIDVPIICVGNAVIGGSGKTPVAIKLRKMLSLKFKKIFVLTKGYKGYKKGPIIINKNYNFHEVGDEAIIHSLRGPTCMSKNRKNGAFFCKKKKSDLIIMDDGLQSKNIKKDIAILVIDSEYCFGNEKIFPAGPLRQKINSALKISDIILIIGNNKKINSYKNDFKKKAFFAEKRISFNNLKKNNVFAFSGLGNNENFFNLLKKNKFIIKASKKFPDHYPYKESDIKQILKTAKKNKLNVVCTEKDFVKIPEKYRKLIYVAKLEIKLKNEKKFLNYLLSHLRIKKIVN